MYISPLLCISHRTTNAHLLASPLSQFFVLGTYLSLTSYISLLRLFALHDTTAHLQRSTHRTLSFSYTHHILSSLMPRWFLRGFICDSFSKFYCYLFLPRHILSRHCGQHFSHYIPHCAPPCRCDLSISRARLPLYWRSFLSLSLLSTATHNN